VLGRDLKIYERPSELADYRASRLQVFLLPGQARTVELVELVEANLAQICAIASTRQPGTWRLTDRDPALLRLLGSAPVPDAAVLGRTHLTSRSSAAGLS
jgi:hypothetical protein